MSKSGANGFDRVWGWMLTASIGWMVLISGTLWADCDDGPYCESRKTGSMTSVEECRDHKKVLRRRIEERDGKAHGLWQCWDQSGTLVESRQYKNGALTGEVRRLNPSIHQYDVSRYKDDRLDGMQKTYQYNGRNQITGWSEVSYREGQRHGLTKVFTAAGKLERQLCYQNDQMKEDLSNCRAGRASFLKKEVSSIPDGCLMNGRPVDPERSGTLEGQSGTVRCMKNGRPVLEQSYRDGREAGVSRAYHANGKLAHLKWFESGSPVLWITYNDRGQLSHLACGSKSYLPEDRELCGFNGKPSEVKLYSGQGTFLRTLTVLQGTVVETTRYAYDGQKLETEKISDTGKVKTTFHPNGKIHIAAEYQGAVLDGAEREYHSSGKLIRLARWEKGRMISEETYYLNGERKARSDRKKKGDVWLIARQTFWDNGQLQDEGVYQEKTETIRWEGFAIDRWTYESPVGVHRQYAEDGKPVVWENYDDAGRVRRRKTWNAAGDLVEDVELLEDGSRVRHPPKGRDNGI